MNIFRDRAVVTVDRSTVFGDDCHVAATKCHVTGDRNVVVGDDNRVIGDHNRVRGDRNQVRGRNCTVEGEECSVKDAPSPIKEPRRRIPKPKAARAMRTAATQSAERGGVRKATDPENEAFSSDRRGAAWPLWLGGPAAPRPAHVTVRNGVAMQTSGVVASAPLPVSVNGAASIRVERGVGVQTVGPGGSMVCKF